VREKYCSFAEKTILQVNYFSEESNKDIYPHGKHGEKEKVYPQFA
jgi:hypothetical protein